MQGMQGKLEAIWIKRARLGPMDAVEQAVLVKGEGLRGNANVGGKRQVTLLSRELWTAVQTHLGVELDPSLRRANLLIAGIDFSLLRRRLIHIGEALLHIHGETRPCERMDEAWPGLQSALQPAWYGGAFGEVLRGGIIRLGDVVWIE